MSVKVKIENINAIAKAEFFLPEPGVYELLGAPGSGKSATLAVVTEMISGSGSSGMELTARDGTEKGRASINGLNLLSVTQARKRASGGADLEFAVLSNSPLMAIIEPRFETKDARERARIAGVIELLQTKVTDGLIKLLVDGDGEALAYLEATEGIDELKKLDAITVSDKIARGLHAYKRQFGTAAEQAEGEMLAHTPTTPVTLIGMPVAEAQTAYDEAVRGHERQRGEFSQRKQQETLKSEMGAIGVRPDVESLLKAEREAFGVLELARDKAARAKASFDGLPVPPDVNAATSTETRLKAELQSVDVQADGLRKEIERIQQELRVLDERRAGLVVRVDEAVEHRVSVETAAQEWISFEAASQAEHAAAQTELKTALGDHRLAEESLHTAEAAARDWDQRKVILDKPLSGASEEDVASSARDLEVAAAQLEAARQSQAYRDTLVAYDTADHARKLAREKEAHLEALARGVANRLGLVLQGEGLKNLTVVEGVLTFIHEDGHPEPFYRRSLAERIDPILDVYIEKLAQMGSGELVPLLTVSASIWSAFNRDDQLLIAERAASKGVYILTERPEPGELRLERVGRPEPATEKEAIYV